MYETARRRHFVIEFVNEKMIQGYNYLRLFVRQSLVGLEYDIIVFTTLLCKIILNESHK